VVVVRSETAATIRPVACHISSRLKRSKNTDHRSIICVLKLGIPQGKTLFRVDDDHIMHDGEPQIKDNLKADNTPLIGGS
jgi:hypothetical protein